MRRGERCAPALARRCAWGCGFGECLRREAGFRADLPAGWQRHAQLVDRGDLEAPVSLEALTRDPRDWGTALALCALVAVVALFVVVLLWGP